MIIFVDSFDHYDPPLGSVLNKGWTGIGGFITNVPGQARTGIGCIDIESGGAGPQRIVGPRDHLLFGFAAWVDTLNVVYDMVVMHPSDASPFLSMRVYADQSLGFGIGNGNSVLCRSAPNVLPIDRWTYIEIKLLVAVAGLAEIRVNGVVVCTFSGNTIFPGNAPDVYLAQFKGQGGFSVTRFDDLYILDWSTAPNDDYLAPANSTEGIAVEVFVPVANGSIIEWTPLSGSIPNFAEVNEIPPDGDTSYNFDPNVGDIDNYVFTPNVPVNTVIFGAQFNMDARLDNPVGSRSIQPNVNGVGQPAGSVALSIDYQIYSTPFDVNPHTGVAFVPGDFPATQFGPEVSA